MKRQFTTRRWLIWSAVLALNAGIWRALIVQEMFTGGVVMMTLLQVAIWKSIRGKGRLRGFWIGFAALGSASITAMAACEELEQSPGLELLTTYIMLVDYLSYRYVPWPIHDWLQEHYSIFIAIVCFVPQIVVALLGGAIVAAFARSRPSKQKRVARDDVDAQTIGN